MIDDALFQPPDSLFADADDDDPELGGAAGLESEPSGKESEDDLSFSDDLSDVTLAPSDWTVETVLLQLQQGTFELDPEFQRRNAWTDQRKSKFIESLILGLPIPQLIFAYEEDRSSGEERYVVIDGKQRLLAINSFFSEEKPLRLGHLTVLHQLNGLTREEILQDPALARYAKRIRNRTIRTVVIKQWKSNDFLHLVFHRLNHQTLPLSPQELRQALNPGPFTSFADSFAAASDQLHRVLGVKEKPDFRMRDVELLVRHLSFRTRLEDYAGNLKVFLDETCRTYNEAWDETRDVLFAESQECNDAIDATYTIFEGDAFRRYADGHYESRFNRAIFDIMTYYFAQPELRASALQAKASVKSAYESLSNSSSNFQASVSSTTKTTTATAIRLAEWGEQLRKILSVDIAVPALGSDKKIHL
ncbi:DUF262 domain-containing protein [Serinicoccus chungangensis]|uniref:DUF262 domain-containing protein n=1 Tax=Serinicoccus chungangensis TaxID=767452 RepID=UPI0011181CDC|nr:DUF262 domain-containing protein [Serinicoccus chungangensis]